MRFRGVSIQDRHFFSLFFFLSGEVFKDQALLLTFISAGLHSSGIVGRCNRRAVYPCLCLALRICTLTLSPILSPPCTKNL